MRAPFGGLLLNKLNRFSTLITSVVYAVIVLLFAIAQHNSFPDDVFITLRFARNLSEGHGLVFNVGQHYLGTSGPGYAILLGLFGKVVGENNLPLVAECLAGLAIFLTSMGLFIGFNRKGWGMFGFTAGLLYIVLPFTRTANGFEVLLQIACIVWGYHLYWVSRDEQKPGYWSALLVALGMFFRPDGVIWFLPLVAHSWFTSYQSYSSSVRQLTLKAKFLAAAQTFPRKETTTAAIVLVIGELLVWLTSGMFLPVTFGAKVAQKISTDWDTFLVGGGKWILEITRSNQLMVWLVCLTILGLAMVGYGVLTKRNLLVGLLLTGVTLHFTLYSLRLPSYGWYYAPEGLGSALLISLTIHYGYKLATRFSAQLAAFFLIVVTWYGIQLVLVQRQVVEAMHNAMANSEKIRVYNSFGCWLKDHTAPNASVGLCEVGIIGWVSKRPIVDQFFLVSPGDIDSIGRHIYDKSFKDSQPTYIAESPLLFGTMRGHEWFWQNYEFIGSYPSKRNVPLSPIEADTLRKQGKIEIDLWQHRATPLARSEASALAAQSRAEMKRWADAHKNPENT